MRIARIQWVEDFKPNQPGGQAILSCTFCGCGLSSSCGGSDNTLCERCAVAITDQFTLEGAMLRELWHAVQADRRRAKQWGKR